MQMSPVSCNIICCKFPRGIQLNYQFGIYAFKYKINEAKFLGVNVQIIH